MTILIDLQGKSALVTGGTRGIGREITLKLAQAGAHVGAIYHNNKDYADSLAEQFRIQNLAELIVEQADLAKFDQARENVMRVVERLGNKLDILVLNAAVASTGALDESFMDQWHKVFQTNLFGNIELLQACSGVMQPGGSVIVISSGAGHDPIEGLSAYGASKAALMQAAQVLAQEWGPRGIRVNIVSPGSTQKQPPYNKYLNENQQATVNATALRRMGTALDVADVVLFFASDLSSFVTGQWLRVNGGRI